MFRILAMGLGLSVFVLAEGVCHLFGWGKPSDFPDPYVGFQEIHPLFVLDESEEKFEIPKSRLGFFAVESFPAEKSASTFRIFCLGGSTVQGRPYSKPTSFTTWLELSLNAGDSRHDWDVINCGGISYASYRLVPILKECLTHQPDFIILCTGHNEFLEERTYHKIKHAPKYISVPMKTLSQLRTFTLLRSAYLSFNSNRNHSSKNEQTTLKTKVDALLDYNRGIEAYHRDDAWREGVIEHFDFNVRRMIRLCKNANVPVILILPPSNLRDSPPFKSEQSPEIAADHIAEWKKLTTAARSHFRDDLQEAAKLLEQAIKVNPRHAVTHYELAKCYDGLWQKTHFPRWKDKATASYRQAREEDICPLRMIAPLENKLLKIATDTHTTVIDAHQLLEQKTDIGILGDGYLVDHVHPSPVRGHQIIARALADEMKRREWFQPSLEWDTRRQLAFQNNLKSLDSLYFPHGQRTLKSLRDWSQGRADGPPIESRKSQ
jgi:hypothetical protein